MPTEINYKWTAIFLFKGVDDNSMSLKEVLAQLLTVRKTDHIGIVICINIKAELLPEDFPRKEGAKSEGWTTVFCAIKNNKLDLIDETENFDIRIEEHVKAFFKEKVLVQFSAEEYMLFTWDHGQPFGIFSGDGTPPTIVNPNNPLVIHFKLWHKFPQLQADTKLKNATSEKYDILTITELKKAIEWAFGTKKIGVLTMSNCYLQFFDTGYELSSCVDYLVAFQTYMYFADHFDYKEVLEAASCNPAITAKTISEILVTKYGYQTNPEKANLSLVLKNDVALFANDLSWYPVIAKLLDELSNELIRELPRNFRTIKAAVEKCGYLSPEVKMFCLIDFRNFIESLNCQMPSIFKGNSYHFLHEVLNKVVVRSFVGPKFKNEDGAQLISPSCFSIYLPSRPGIFHTGFRDRFMTQASEHPTEFVKYFRWDAFIASFMAILEANPQSYETNETD